MLPTVAPFHTNDLEEVLQLLHRELPADFISSELFQQKVLLDPNFRPEGALVARSGKKIVGFMLGMVRARPLEDATPDTDRGWITLMAVDSDMHRQGIGTQLLDGVIAYFKDSCVSTAWVSPYAPNYFLPGLDEAAYSGAIEFLKKSGFEVAYRPLSMEALLIDFSAPDWMKDKETALINEGVDFEAFKPEHIISITEFLRAEFPGDWQRHMRETMLQIAGGVFAAEQLLVAMEAGRCVGFCQHAGERFGPFGVSASQRGRGLGAVLLMRCLKSMSEKGFYRSWFLWTDDKAAKLYAEAGFHETRRYSVMKRIL